VNSVSNQQASYFTKDQAACILEFAAQVAGSRSALRGVRYHVMGMADLAKKEEAAALVRSLQSQDWESAARHRELAGGNDLLVGLLLHIDVEGERKHDYWIAMRSPFDYLDSASLLTCGEIALPPRVSMSELPLEQHSGS
jgi:hypothetical protein